MYYAYIYIYNIQYLYILYAIGSCLLYTHIHIGISFRDLLFLVYNYFFYNIIILFFFDIQTAILESQIYLLLMIQFAFIPICFMHRYLLLSDDERIFCTRRARLTFFWGGRTFILDNKYYIVLIWFIHNKNNNNNITSSYIIISSLHLGRYRYL